MSLNGITPSQPNPPPEPIKSNEESVSSSGQEASTTEQEEKQSAETHITPEKTPEAMEDMRAQKLKEWVIFSSRLLKQTPSSKKGDFSEINTEKGITDSLEKADEFRKRDIVENKISDVQIAQDTAITSVKTAAQFGASVDVSVFSGFSYAFTVSKEVTAGVNFLGSKWEIRNLKLEREALMERIQQLPPDDKSTAFELNRQKEVLDKKIQKLEMSSLEKLGRFVAAHLEGTLTAIFTLLSYSKNQKALIGASAGGTALAYLGAGTSAISATVGAVEYAQVNQKLVKIVQSNEAHKNPEVSAAMGSVKTAAIDHAAFHQKQSLAIGIFQNAFAFCQASVTAIASTFGTLALAAVGTATGAAATSVAASMAPALPILTGVGLLISGAIFVYQNRNQIFRGLTGLFQKNRGSEKLSRFDLARNLTIRQISRQNELKNMSARLIKLGTLHAKLEAGENPADVSVKIDQNANFVVRAVKTLFSPSIEKIKDMRLTATERKYGKIDLNNPEAAQKAMNEVANEIYKLSVKFYALKDELETIENKMATQQLRDETGSISNATIVSKGFINTAIVELESRIEDTNSSIAKLKGEVPYISPENALRKLNNEKLKGLRTTERELEQRLENISKPETRERIKNYNEGKLAEKKEQLSLELIKPKGQYNESLVKELKESIVLLEKHVEGEGQVAVDHEKERLETLNVKVKEDINAVINPLPEAYIDMINNLETKKAQLRANVDVLSKRLETIDKEQLLNEEFKTGEEGFEMKPLDELEQEYIDPNSKFGTQLRLSRAIEELGDGEDLIEFVNVYKKLGVSFDDLDNKNDKNLYVQTQIYKAIVSGTLEFKS